MTDRHARLAPPAPIALVVDDEDYVAKMLAIALDSEGYTVHCAYNGRDGFERSQTLAMDIVVVDIMMPHMSGEELTEALRAAPPTRDVPILLISAGARPRKQWPNVVFMPKPFDLDQLIDTVNALVQESRTRERP